MHNVWIIIRREYTERVRTKAFWITTILVPVLMAVVTVGPAKLMMSQRGGSKHIAIVVSDEAFGHTLERSLQRSAGDTTATKYTVDVVTPGTPAQKAELEGKVERSELDGFLWATDDALAGHKLSYSARTTSDLLEAATLKAAAKLAQLERDLGKLGVSSEKLQEALKQDLEVEMVRVEAGKAAKASGKGAFFGVMAMVLTLYMAIVFHGVAVMRSVLEEKTSRIIEVLLASVTPKELMAGKILGVGAVGLTQLAIWFGASALVLGPSAALTRGVSGTIEISAGALAYFPVFFVLGYFLYSALWAMLGAMVNSEQEAQQMQFFVMLPLILSSVMLAPAILNPGSALIVAASLFPFCTPLIMYIRIAASEVPGWQVALSIGLMLAAVYAVLVVASRIYRVGILMYGKRPTLPELWKWFKYA